jgi:hypothetical protein
MIYIQTVLKLPYNYLQMPAKLTQRIGGLWKTASTNSELLVSKTVKEILATTANLNSCRLALLLLFAALE